MGGGASTNKSGVGGAANKREPSGGPPGSPSRTPRAAIVVDGLREQNMAAHHTDAFDEPALVVRRAQAVRMRATCSAATHGTDLEWHATALSSTGASEPLPFPCPPVGADAVGPDDVTKAWGVVASRVADDAFDVRLCISAEAPVGRYELTLSVTLPDGTVATSTPLSAIVLFNPWSPADVVWLGDEAERAEYVLADTGHVHTGRASGSLRRPHVEWCLFCCAVE